MVLSETEIVGNTHIQGTFKGSALITKRPNTPTPEEQERGKRGDEWVQEILAQPDFQADTINLTWRMIVAEGTRVVARLVTAPRIEVNGTLEAKHVLGSDGFFAGPKAVVDCAVHGFAAVRLHREATVRGELARQVERNAELAQQLLEASLQNPEVLDRVDFAWLEKAHELNGWTCVARSSSGNGCNYALERTSGNNDHSHYVNLRKSGHNFAEEMRRTLAYLTVTRGYEFPHVK